MAFIGNSSSSRNEVMDVDMVSESEKMLVDDQQLGPQERIPSKINPASSTKTSVDAVDYDDNH